jgi:hypothetical protein
MKIPTLLVGGLVLGTLLCSAPPLRAQSDSCALLKSFDLSMLLGGPTTAKSDAGACTWTAAGSPKKLMAAAMTSAGPAAEMAYAGARQAAAKGGTVPVTDEPGLGDKAFAVQTSFGVAMVMLKGGRLLQLQYWTGAAGTAADVAALRPVARKAIAAF